MHKDRLEDPVSVVLSCDSGQCLCDTESLCPYLYMDHNIAGSFHVELSFTYICDQVEAAKIRSPKLFLPIALTTLFSFDREFRFADNVFITKVEHYCEKLVPQKLPATCVYCYCMYTCTGVFSRYCTINFGCYPFKTMTLQRGLFTCGPAHHPAH